MQNQYCYLLVEPVQVHEISSTTLDIEEIISVTIKEEPVDPEELEEIYQYDEYGRFLRAVWRRRDGM